ncbi:MAG: TolC family protein [Thermoanaerobaculum sp.]|nr:TolC family protein [Thermoanaerobaculum sp.]MCX7894886.1 TolC family protein [Thermoanaerobaculum sp.]MDW7966527.1 TolC family protein [Thermoanaerobaculum sp.]
MKKPVPFFFLIAALPLAAQELLTLSEEQAVALALEASPRLREAQALAQASQGAVLQAQARLQPRLTITANAERRNPVPEFRLPQELGGKVLYPSIETTGRLNATLSRNLDLAGTLAHLQAVAVQRRTAQEMRVLQVRQEVALQARMAFWQALAATATAEVAEKDLERAQQTLADTETLREVGLTADPELLTARAELERARVSLGTARGQVHLALVSLRSLLGLAVEQAVALQKPSQLPPAPPPLEDLLLQGRAQRPELQALQLQLEALQRQVAAERAGGKPTLSLAASYQWEQPNSRFFPLQERWRGSWWIGAAATWSPWDGGELAGRVAQAQGEVEAARAQLREAQRQVDLEVTKARQRVVDALALLPATAAAVEAAKAREEAVREGFRVGIASLSDVVDAQTALARAEGAWVQSQIAAWEAQAYLLWSVGR